MEDQRLPGEMTLTEVKRLWNKKWGLGGTRVWELVCVEGKVPVRRTPWRFYVPIADAEAYVHDPKRGRQPKQRGAEGAA